MRFNALYIIAGLSFLYLLGTSMVVGFSYIYYRYVLKQKFELKILSKLTTISLVWLLTALFSLAFFAVLNIFIFGLLFFVMFGAILFGLSSRLLSIDGKHKIVYSLSLAFLLNPVWLFLMGIGR